MSVILVAALIGLTPGSSPHAAAEVSATSLCSKTLRQGDSGRCVRRLQRRLNELGLNHGNQLTIDGAFGPVTRDRVEAFQGRNRLAMDGVVGAGTRRKLRNPDEGLSVVSRRRVRRLIREIWPDGKEERAIEVARCESRFNPIAINRSSGARAIGVFQFHTGGTLQEYLGSGRIGRDRALHARKNIRAAKQLQRDRGWSPWVCAQSRSASPDLLRLKEVIPNR